MEDSHVIPSAGPVQIVSITDDHKFVLDEVKLKQILFNRRAIGKKVCRKRKLDKEETCCLS